MTGVEYLIDPKRLLRVTFLDSAGGQRDVSAVTCAYVPALGPDGSTRVGIQIVWDPGSPNPGAPYYCPQERLKWELVEPKRVLKVRPY